MKNYQCYFDNHVRNWNCSATFFFFFNGIFSFLARNLIHNYKIFLKLLLLKCIMWMYFRCNPAGSFHEKSYILQTEKNEDFFWHGPMSFLIKFVRKHTTLIFLLQTLDSDQGFFLFQKQWCTIRCTSSAFHLLSFHQNECRPQKDVQFHLRSSIRILKSFQDGRFFSPLIQPVGNGFVSTCPC